VYIVGNEGHIFDQEMNCFNACDSYNNINLKKIRRPIPLLAKTINDPIFLLEGRCPENRGHFLCEHLTRWLLAEKLLKNAKYLILVSSRQKEWQSKYLSLNGVPEDHIIEAEIGTVFCKEVYYVPLLSSDDTNILGPISLFKEIRSRMIKDITNNQKKQRRILFLSREDAPDRKLLNERKLVSILSEKTGQDVELLKTGELTLHDQIKVFSEASIIVGAHGQPFKNILFSKDLKCLQLINGKNNEKNEFKKWALFYSALGNLNDSNICTIDYSDIEVSGAENWYYPEEKFITNLNTLLAIPNHFSQSNNC
jgi:capsular polysaccharide biosynthesis protein